MKILVVDGYNVINRIEYLAEIADRDLKDARDAVTELANEYKKRDGGISEVYVVFDGQNQYKDLDIPRRKEHIFSDSGEGDRKIIETIRRVSNKGTVVVVSDDNYVRNNARAYSSNLMRPVDLLEK
ncbi:MAG: NYN domain-containing protein [Elusimicrobia bacterium]|nr:NYN domain-containing protein [Elusimicrobiota bacterium]